LFFDPKNNLKKPMSDDDTIDPLEEEDEVEETLDDDETVSIDDMIEKEDKEDADDDLLAGFGDREV